MADEGLRRIQRQADAGDPEAEARLLLERLRIGELQPEGVEIAAYLGHGAAGRVVPHVTPAADPDPQVWVQGLGQSWGKAAVVRAAIFAARAVLPRFEQTLTHEQIPRQTLLAAEAWLERPGEARRVAAGLAAHLADDCAREASVQPEADDDTAFAAYAARDAARAAAAHDLPHACHQACQALDSAGGVELDDDPVLAARAALIAWGLGEDGSSP